MPLGILPDAKEGRCTTAYPAESGQDEFDIEYGENFTRHIEASDPIFCRRLVIAGRYHDFVDIFEKSRSVTEAT
jgi:hypothetical protein